MPGTRPIRPELAALANKYGRGLVHMGQFPVEIQEVEVQRSVVNTASLSMLGAEIAALGLATPVATAWPIASRAVQIPWYVEEPFRVGQVLWLNGAVVSGNVDVGIYTNAARRVVSIGGVAQAGINLTQAADLQSTLLEPGHYLVLFELDNVVGQVVCWNFVPVLLGAVMDAQERTAAYPLPIAPGVANASMGVIPFVRLQDVRTMY